MKSVITSNGNTPDSLFDLRFGRASWFCIFDEQSKETSFIENTFVNESDGLGLKVAKLLIEYKVTKVISGDFGHNAKDFLDQNSVQLVVIKNDNYTIEDILKKLSSKPISNNKRS